MAFRDERSRISHLLRRAGFAPSPAELDLAVSRGFDGTLDQLLNPPDDHDASDDVLNQIPLDLTKLNEAQRWWLVRMRYTSRPLVEKMTLFWHGHFATGVGKVGRRNLDLMRQQNELFRTQGLGNFRDLLLNVSRDPAMLIWLDGRLNHKNAPNENFGRELMELFTLGIGNYSEDDVKAAARSFTGSTLTKDRQYAFNPKDHDASPKTYLGQTGSVDGGDIVNILAAQPATASFLATKLARFFVTDPPDSSLVAELAKAYLSSNYDMRTVLRTLFKSDAFSSDAAYHALIKSPAEFVVGALRSLDVPTNGQGLPAAMAALGQVLFNPPNVAGWPAGESWIATNTMLARASLANAIVAAAKPDSGFFVDPKKLFGLGASMNAADLIRSITDHLVDGDLSSDERAHLLTYLSADSSVQIDTTRQELKVRGLVYLAMASPEYSLN
jgi:uncharacterized protein (DUF1800 family)